MQSTLRSAAPYAVNTPCYASGVRTYTPARHRRHSRAIPAGIPAGHPDPTPSGPRLAHVYFFGCKLLKVHGRFSRLVTT